jgi:hypothetical protein
MLAKLLCKLFGHKWLFLPDNGTYGLPNMATCERCLHREKLGETVPPHVREALAAYAHDAWAGWMKYLFQKSAHVLSTGEVVIPTSLVERWMRQMNTPYTELPENERESDRLEADRMIEIYEAR